MEESQFDAECKSLKVVHLALCLGVVLFMGAMFFNVNAHFQLPSDYLFSVICAALLMGGVLGQKVVDAKMIAPLVDSGATLTQKFQEYRMAFMVKAALLEVPCMFAGICVFLKSNVFYALFALVGLSFLALLRPNKASIKQAIGF